MEATNVKMSPKQMQHGKRLHQDRKFKIFVITAIILVDILFVYSAVWFLTKPVILQLMWNGNEKRDAAPTSDNHNLQLRQSVNNSTSFVMHSEQVKICSRLADTANDLNNNNHTHSSATQKPQKVYSEFVYCVATKINRTLSDIQQEFVRGNGKVEDLRIGSGRQRGTNVIRVLFETVREADQAILSGKVPIITIRMNPRKLRFVNRLAYLMKLDPCREAVIKACAAFCDAARSAC